MEKIYGVREKHPPQDAARVAMPTGEWNLSFRRIGD